VLRWELEVQANEIMPLLDAGVLQSKSVFHADVCLRYPLPLIWQERMVHDTITSKVALGSSYQPANQQEKEKEIYGGRTG
jgi:hypothetical protein